MENNISLANITDAFVSITRFNRGEANKIFDEVRSSGLKIVMKNNTPACILLAPELYKEIVDIIDDRSLLVLVEDRIKNDTGASISFEEILAQDGLVLSDIEKMEDVDIG